MARAKKEKNPAVMSDAEAINALMNGVATVPSPKPKSSSANREVVEMTDKEFESYIALEMLADAVETVKEELDGRFKKGFAMDHHLENLVKTGAKPDAFDAIGGEAACQFQHRKRSAVKPTEDFPLLQKKLVDVLNENNIPYERKESVSERLIINPEISDNQEILAKMARALLSADLGVQAIMKQEAVFKYSFTDATFAAIAKVKDPAIRKELFKAVSTPAISQQKLCGLEGLDCLDKALEIIQKRKILDLAKVLPKKKKSSYRSED